jgi:hypothetical protein
MKSVVKLIRKFILAGFLPKIAKIEPAKLKAWTKSVMYIPGSREMHPINVTDISCTYILKQEMLSVTSIKKPMYLTAGLSGGIFLGSRYMNKIF